MGKRGNDNSQLSKEELEALESREGNVEAGTFAKASGDILSRRKIIRSSSKWKERAAAANPGNGGGNVFANFSFGKTPASAPASTPSKPAFAMPTLPSYNTGAGIKTTTTTPASTQPSAQNSNNELDQLASNFKKYIADVPLRAVYELPVKVYMNTYFHLSKNDKKTVSADLDSSTTDATPESTSKPLFPSIPASAPAPVPFSFGTASSSASSPKFSFNAASAAPPASSPAPAPKFSFGGPSMTPGASAAAPKFSFGGSSAAPTDSSSSAAPKFSFGGAPVTPAAAPKFSFGAASTSAAASTTSAPSDGGDDAEDGVKDEEPTVLGEGADEDWNTVGTTKVNAYHYREKTPTKFASGDLKIQQLKADSKNRRMVMRNTTGKVTLNLKITSSMTFDKKITPGKPGRSPNCRIVFFGLQDKERGPEMFVLQCKKEDLDSLHNKLVEMTE